MVLVSQRLPKSARTRLKEKITKAIKTDFETQGQVYLVEHVLIRNQPI